MATNSNCLEGIACPECKSQEPFFIVVQMTVQVWDDGTEPGGDSVWDDESLITCCACGHYGKVKEFAVPEESADERT